MTDRRQNLHQLLSDLHGAKKVYFQEPSSGKMEYPCIIYHLDGGNTSHADNHPYYKTKRYQVTVIDRDPDSDLPDKVRELPTAAFQRWFATEGLNHYVFTIHS